MAEKVLIITYYWPPAGGPGVQRWLKFVKYLREFAIEPVVYIPEDPNYPFTDSTLSEEIPEGITLWKKSIFEPYKLASAFAGKEVQTISKGIIPEKKQTFIQKSLLWLRGNLFIPDARRFWVAPSIKFLKKKLAKEDIGTIITTGPPHSIHLIGSGLKKHFPHLRWIADFRDPWTTIGYHKDLKLTKYARQMHEKLEKKVLTTTDHILVTSPSTATLFKKLTSQPVSVITNGFDKIPDTHQKPSNRFVIAHIGSLLTGRNPKILWEVLAELQNEVEGFTENFELALAGIASKEVLEDVYSAGLQSNTRVMGYISHDEVLRLQASASVLVLIEIDREETRSIIPGKLFEYMASQTPVIAIGPQEWDVFDILKKTGVGSGYTYSQKQELKEKIVSYYQNFTEGVESTSYPSIENYSRKSLTAKLANVIKNI